MFFGPSSLSAQRQFLIQGLLLEERTDTPVPSTAVWLLDSEGQEVREPVFSDANGRFVMPVPPPGRYSFRVSRIGFEVTETFEFDMPEGEPITLTIYLSPRPFELEEFLVSVERGDLMSTSFLADFYWRSEHGLGRYITREELDRAPTLNFLDVMSSVPGVAVIQTSLGPLIQIKRATANLGKFNLGDTDTLRSLSATQDFSSKNQCPPTIFIDGMQLNRHEDPSFAAIEAAYTLTAEQIEGIEVYRGPSEVPGEFMRADAGRCGVLLVWTRRRLIGGR